MQARQIKIEDWKPGNYETVALLHGTAEELSQRLGIAFQDDCEDGLGKVKVACFRTGRGNQFSLVQYLQAPNADVIYIQSLNDTEQMAHNLDEILQSIDVTEKDLLWKHPHLLEQEMVAG